MAAAGWGLAASCSVGPDGPPRELTVTPSSTAVSCVVGQTIELTVSVGGATGTPTLGLLTQGESAVATGRGSNVSVACASPGTATVTIGATDGGRTASASVSVTVATPPPLGITVQPAAVSCMAGDTVAVSLGVTGGVGTSSVAVQASGAAVTATASPRTATVTCVAPGTATVTVTATSGAQTVSATLPVTVTPVLPLTVALEPAELACTLGDSARVSARVSGSRSGRPAVSFVATDGPVRVAAEESSATVRCAAPGSATITVTAVDGRQRGSAALRVSVTLRPQTVVLFATPKFIPDFDAPEASVDAFLQHYEPLTSRAAETIVIFAVGNSEHILMYRGSAASRDSLKWARYTDGKLPGIARPMYYDQVARIVRAFKARAAARGIRLKVFDQVDPGNEFVFEVWKYDLHPECMDRTWDSFDVRARLKGDTRMYASAPRGISDGTPCAAFLVNQVEEYLRDLAFDGILYGNQFGTRGRWLPDNGPGYTDAEAAGIRDFLDYSRATYRDKQLMWFDSYNDTRVEHDVYSFPSDGYQRFDYVIASGFAVVTEPTRYLDDLRSKLAIPRTAAGAPRILATLDYVDPWYTYNSMTTYPDESARLEQIAIEYRDRVDGLVFFANDEVGNLVPRSLIESFAARYFGP